jgi:hypothetical protein
LTLPSRGTMTHSILPQLYRSLSWNCSTFLDNRPIIMFVLKFKGRKRKTNEDIDESKICSPNRGLLDFFEQWWLHDSDCSLLKWTV